MLLPHEDYSPPPSYAIFIGSGDSHVMPPSYKMLFPESTTVAVTEQEDRPSKSDVHRKFSIIL